MSTAGQVVVFDTNVLIPLSIKASRATRIFSRLTAASWSIAASPAMLDEVAEKMRTKDTLRRWLKLSDRDIESFLTLLPVILRMEPGFLVVEGAVPADPKDDKII